MNQHNGVLCILYYHMRYYYGIGEILVLPYVSGTIEPVVKKERNSIYWSYSKKCPFNSFKEVYRYYSWPTKYRNIFKALNRQACSVLGYSFGIIVSSQTTIDMEFKSVNTKSKQKDILKGWIITPYWSPGNLLLKNSRETTPDICDLNWVYLRYI